MYIKLRLVKLILFAFILFALLGLSQSQASAQCTANPVTNNANNTVLFNVHNTNTFDIQVTDASSMINTGAAGTYGFEILYNTTAVASTGATWTQGIVGAGQNGWVSGGTGNIVLPAHTAPTTVLSGLNIIVPAGATYGFALTLTSSSTGLLQDYTNLTTAGLTGVQTASSGGVDILTGDNISWGAPVLPATPANYPRGFRGCIGWMSTVPCTGSPNNAVAAGPATSSCPNTAFTLSATGATVAVGVTHQWEVYNTGTSAWDPISGATTLNYTVTAGIAAATDYRLVSTCANGGGQGISNAVTVTPSLFYNCYCGSVPANTGDGEISNVTFWSLNNSSTCTVAAPGTGSILNRYSNFQTLTPTVILQGANVPFSVAANTCNGNYTGVVKVYIDYDHDGTFTGIGEEAFASTTFTYGPGVVISGTIAIPNTATPGITGMRVIQWESNSVATVVPCMVGTPYGYGETEDYLIDIQVPVGCTGTPAAVTASGPAMVCANSNFTVTATGFTTAGGINYQWEQYNTATSTWDPIANATNPSYTVTGGISASTDFHFVTTCSNGGGQDVSNTVTVALNPFFQCYCGPATGVNLNQFPSNYLTSVSIPGTPLNNPTTTMGTSGYSLYYPTTTSTTANLTQGVQYTLDASHPYTGYYTAAWIDFDQSGTFDAAEYVQLTTNGLNATATFIVPLTATPGQTGMRLRTYWTSLTSGQACAANNSYETEDYVITIDQALPCGGTPAVATASAPSSVCANSNFNLTASGYTTGLGITYQWEQYNTATSTWDPIVNATNPSYTVTGGISTATEYHFVTTCANGGGQDISASVSVGISAFYVCYCGPATGVTLNSVTGTNYITNVTVNTSTLNNTTTSTPSNSYNLFFPTTTTTTADLEQGVQYSINTSHLYTYYFTEAWIDYDQSGTFDAGEYVQLTTASGGNSLNATANFTVPMSATPGLTGMRVRLYWTTIGAGGACNSNSSYETEDYVVNITVAPPCSGTPATAVAAGPTGACSGANFDLTATGYTTGTGITYQWQQYNTGTSTWDPIANATNPTYTVTGGITTATDYQFVTTCANGGGQSISNTVNMTMNPFYQCYCASRPNSTGDGEISNVTFGTLNNSSSCNVAAPGAGSLANQYSNFTTLAATSVPAGTPVSFSIAANTCGGNYGGFVKIYIDFDHDGTFTGVGEEAFVSGNITYGPGVIVSGSVAIPATATPGVTGMRVILWETTSAATVTPCQVANTYGYGETEDYLLDIQPAVNCSGTPAVTTAFGPSSICPNVTFTLSASGYTTGLGITYQWEQYNSGTSTWDPIANATNTSYIVSGGISTATNYHFVTTCSNGGGQDISNQVAVAINLPTQCYCTPTYSNGGTSDYITNVTLGNLTNNTTAAGNPTPYYVDYTTQQPGTIAIPDLAQGLSYNLSISFGTDPNQYHGVWVDFDQNGLFDAAEFITTGTNPGGSGTVTVPIPVPLTATLGQTRMRIRGGDDSQPSATQACGATNSTYGQTEDYLVNVIAAPSCLAPTGIVISNTTSSSTDIDWATASGAVGYEYAITNSATPPASGTSTTSTSVVGATFSGSIQYYLHVRTDCGSGNFSSWSTISFFPGNNANGAAPLVVNGGCTGNPYTNVGATQSPGEPYPSCNDYSTGNNTVWFKFTAPASGAVRVSTDMSPQGTLEDSKIALFSATDPNNYATFQIISCDEDGGTVGDGYNSVLFAAGLTGGQTYYVQVDGFDAGIVGTFCISVDEITSSMIATAGSCTDLQLPQMENANYTGWFPLLTDGTAAGDAKLVALVRNPTGVAGIDFDETSVTVNTGAVRQDANGMKYLDRNYRINNAVATGTTELMFFIPNSEITALGNAMGAAITLGDLNVTKQTGSTCSANFDAANGTESALLQTSNGTNGTISWITVGTTSFSNFYIMAGANPLVADLGDISATNVGSRNRVDWNTLTEQNGDYFEVERSADGASYSRVGTISGKGVASSYSFWDNAPVSGVNYYRLKMADVSGRFAYSEVVTATLKDGNVFSMEAFPNPVSDGVVTVRTYGTAGTNATVSVSDATGKVVKVIEVTNNIATIDMNGMAQGVYLLKYADDAHNQTIKINKQ